MSPTRSPRQIGFGEDSYTEVLLMGLLLTTADSGDCPCRHDSGELKHQRPQDVRIDSA